MRHIRATSKMDLWRQPAPAAADFCESCIEKYVSRGETPCDAEDQCEKKGKCGYGS